MFPTEWSRHIDDVLRPNPYPSFTALDLFAGCGGLSLGFEAAGFSTVGYEMLPDPVATYTANLNGECHTITLTEETPFPPADIIIGGPPCQPFSVNGKQKGTADSRNGFPAFISAVRQVKPRMFLFENVKGMRYRNKNYLQEVKNDLSCLGYVLTEELLNASNFGVPQNRERLIVVGYRAEFAFPAWQDTKVTVREALGGYLDYMPADGKYLSASQDAYIARYEKKSHCVTPRDLHPDVPARTLTCRNTGGATSDMHRILLPDGRRRRLLPREAARLQSFPDWFTFHGSTTSQFTQIGNAVPPLFAYRLAKQAAETLNNPNH